MTSYTTATHPNTGENKFPATTKDVPQKTLCEEPTRGTIEKWLSIAIVDVEQQKPMFDTLHKVLAPRECTFQEDVSVEPFS
jgi:hypothetical protein